MLHKDLSDQNKSIIAETTLLALPPELFAEILSKLTYEELIDTRLVCSHFRNAYHEFFDLESLWGKSIQFKKWDQMSVRQLAIVADEWDEKHKVSILNQPQHDLVTAFTEHYMYLGFIAIGMTIMAATVLFTFLLTQGYFPDIEPLSLDEQRIVSSFIAVIACTITWWQHIQIQQNNHNYRASLITQKHLQELTLFKYRLPDYAELITALLPAMQAGQISVDQFFTQVKAAINKIKNLSTEFNDCLEYKRDAIKTKLNQSDLETLKQKETHLPLYNSIFNLWSNTHARTSLIKKEKEPIAHSALRK